MRQITLSLLFFTLMTYPMVARSGPGPGGGGGHDGGHRGADDIVTPEPATWLMMATGCGGVLLAAVTRGRKR